MHDRASEVVETLTGRRIDICAAQESCWRGCSTQIITGKYCRYKFVWSGDISGFGGVGILVAEKWIKKIISVDRTSIQQILRLLMGRKILYIISSYALDSGSSEFKKDNFLNLLSSISVVPSEEILLVCGDLNGQVGKISRVFESTGRAWFWIRNSEGTRVLELCAAADLAIIKTYFTKCDSQLLTYGSDNACSKFS